MKLPVFNDPVTNEPSFSVTVAAITFAVVLVKWMLGNQTIMAHEFKPVTNEEITTWLTPTLLLYFGRQATKATEAVAMARSPQSGVNP
jgi:hypothetical protein